MLCKVEFEGKIKDIYFNEGALVLSCLFFADDIILLAIVDQEEVYKLMNILNTFFEASGQRVNAQKFGLIFGKRISPHKKIQLCSILNFQAWNELGKYLGIPA